LAVTDEVGTADSPHLATERSVRRHQMYLQAQSRPPLMLEKVAKWPFGF